MQQVWHCCLPSHWIVEIISRPIARPHMLRSHWSRFQRTCGVYPCERIHDDVALHPGALAKLEFRNALVRAARRRGGRVLGENGNELVVHDAVCTCAFLSAGVWQTDRQTRFSWLPGTRGSSA